jgi:hypothetical protein
MMRAQDMSVLAVKPDEPRPELVNRIQDGQELFVYIGSNEPYNNLNNWLLI